MNFHDNSVPKKGSQFVVLSIISIDSVFKMGKIIHRYFCKSVNML